MTTVSSIIVQQIQYKSLSDQMSKQKLAQMVMQKMQQKKQREEKNRPHRQVLQLLVKFQVEYYKQLQQQIDQISKQLQKQTNVFLKLENYNKQFQNTGKKEYPRIIVKPQFIASEHVQPFVKQFYRKAANTYLREDILKKKQYELDTQRSQQIKNAYEDLRNKQIQITKQKESQQSKLNEKRVRNLKQSLRLRSIKQQQQSIKKTIQDEKIQYKDLIAEYQLKKINLHKRVDWSQKLIQLIESQKRKIESTYNPVTYRQYLKKIFNIRTKNQALQKNLQQARRKVNQQEKKTEAKVQFLQKNDNLFMQGKSSDSPSKRKRYSVTSLGKSPSKKIMPKHSSLLINLKKSLNSQQLNNTSKSLSKQKSFSTSLGKTTVSSMSNLLRNSFLQKADSSFSTPFKNSKKRGSKIFN